MDIGKAFCVVIDIIMNSISDRSSRIVDKSIDYCLERIENSIETVRDKKQTDILISDIQRDDIEKVRKYIIKSMGGIDNIAFIEKCKNGYKFVFYDFEKVEYYHMKHFNCRIFISEKLGSMILLPQNNGMYYDFFNIF